MKKTIIHIFKNTCVWFTILIFTLALITAKPSEPGLGPTLTNQFYFFLLALIFSLVDRVLVSQKINVILKYAVHFIVYVASVFVLFFVLIKPDATKKQILLIGIVVIALYCIGMGIRALIRSLLKNQTKKTSDYNSMFQKNKQ